MQSLPKKMWLIFGPFGEEGTPITFSLRFPNQRAEAFCTNQEQIRGDRVSQSKTPGRLDVTNRITID
jgi:hypothetical protein